MRELTLRVAAPEDAARVSAVLAASYGTLCRGAREPEALDAVLALVSRERPELLASGWSFLALRGDVVAAFGGWSLEDPGSGVAEAGGVPAPDLMSREDRRFRQAERMNLDRKGILS
ncbi:hypothetical protein [Sediminicoccus sp. BL-A-41-H5]|uniref:hypothetical protein n=1 Tax=Sediminicoccus sp. BL-A-41-H5 TaxID=3421106 RepID=UPI003D66C5C9